MYKKVIYYFLYIFFYYYLFILFVRVIHQLNCQQIYYKNSKYCKKKYTLIEDKYY